MGWGLMVDVECDALQNVGIAAGNPCLLGFCMYNAMSFTFWMGSCSLASVCSVALVEDISGAPGSGYGKNGGAIKTADRCTVDGGSKLDGIFLRGTRISCT